jgi:hypothetical protein
MPRSRYRIMDKEKPHFMTATINNWLPVFTRWLVPKLPAWEPGLGSSSFLVTPPPLRP